MRRKETIHNVSIFASEAGAAGGTFSPFFDFFVVCVPEFAFFSSRAPKKKSGERAGGELRSSRRCFFVKFAAGFASFIYSKKTTERTARNTRRAENSRRRRIEEVAEEELKKKSKSKKKSKKSKKKNSK
jgi:hypothetical protein